MNPQTDQTPGFGMPQPPTSMGQVPPMYAPQNFHAPDSSTTHFTGAMPSALPAAPSVAPLTGASAPGMVMQQVAPMQSAPMPVGVPMTGMQPSTVPVANPLATTPAPAALPQQQSDDVDTPQDEEWVGKAKDVIEHTHGDPYTQSIELGKLKAQYIKVRYNKDVKVGE